MFKVYDGGEGSQVAKENKNEGQQRNRRGKRDQQKKKRKKGAMKVRTSGGVPQ